MRWNKADDSGSRLFSWADVTKKVKLHKEVSLMWGLFQPNPVHSHRQLQSMLYGHEYWLKALCAVINSALDVYPKAFYFSKYPSKSTAFSVVQSEQFSAESLAFLTFITTAPRGYITHTKQGFHLPVSHSSPHAALTPTCYAPGSCRKKHWCDTSSCGRFSSAAAAVTPALYCGTNMMKGNKSRDVGLSS